MTEHEDLAHWLSTGDLLDASAVMVAVVHQLLAQLPAEPGDTAAEEALAAQASELAEKSAQFATHLIRRQPVRASARELHRLAAQLIETADTVDDRRSY
ncbi:hypothetical protein ACWEPA_25175 [Streptomyces filamentosus]